VRRVSDPRAFIDSSFYIFVTHDTISCNTLPSLSAPNAEIKSSCTRPGKTNTVVSRTSPATARASHLDQGKNSPFMYGEQVCGCQNSVRN